MYTPLNVRYVGFIGTQGSSISFLSGDEIESQRAALQDVQVSSENTIKTYLKQCTGQLLPSNFY